MIAKKIVRAQTTKPQLFLVAFITVTIALVPGIFLLLGNVEPSLEKVLPSDIEEVKTMNDMRTQFGADMMYIVVRAEDVREIEVLRYIDLIAQKVKHNDYILSVNAYSDFALSNNVLPLSYNVAKQRLENVKGFSNHDYSLALIKIKSDTGASAKAIERVIEQVRSDIRSLEEYNPSANVQITGFNAIDKATFEIIISDFARITLVSFAIVAIIVYLTFRRFMKSLLALSVVMVALTWTLGIVGYSGLTLTVVSMVAAAMVMGLGIDFGIHVVHTFYNYRKKNSAKDAIELTMSELLRAMSGASFTTVAGFLALLFGVLPAMKSLGIILAIGILSTLVSAVFLLPVLVYQYDIRRLTK